MYLKKI